MQPFRTGAERRSCQKNQRQYRVQASDFIWLRRYGSEAAKEFPETKVLVGAKEKDLPTVVPQCKEQKAQVISVLANEFEVGLNLSF